MRTFARHYLMALVPFLLLDALWLGVIAQSLYQQQIGFLLSKNPNWIAAAVFYALFVAGLVVFTVGPGIRGGSLARAAARGAFFGLVTYATYDLTNLATIDRWPVLLTAVDLLWGATLAAVTTTVAVWIGRRGQGPGEPGGR